MGGSAEDNTIAIAELVLIAKQTTKDVDRIIKHLDQAPVVRTIALEKRMNMVERRLPEAISKKVIMWGVVLFLGCVGSVMGFSYTIISSYNRTIEAKVHAIETKMSAHTTEFKQTKEHMKRRVNILEKKVK